MADGGSRSKRLVFTIVPAITLLILATLVLRVLEKERIVDTTRPDDRVLYPSDFRLQKEVDGPEPRWVIPQSASMVESRVPVRKQPGDWRVLVVGGSFAQGSPWVDQHGGTTGYGGIPDWIRAELSMRCPSVGVQVVNAGSGAAGSYAVRQLVDLLMDIEPDVLIVMSGNNEGFVVRTRLNEVLQKWPLYRALKKGILEAPTLEERPFFALQDPDTQKIREQYQRNIRDIVATARRKGAVPILATLPINYKYPTYDKTDAEPQDPVVLADAAIQLGNEYQYQHGNWARAIEEYVKSPNEVWAARYIGECLEELGRAQEAREMLDVYVENMPLNRIRPSMNAFLRDFAKEENVVLVDLEEYAKGLSPTGITSSDFFVDFCHMTWRGYYQMGQEILRVMWERGLVKHGPGEPGPKPSLDEVIRAQGWTKLNEPAAP